MISLIIPTYNKLARLKLMLTSLLNQTLSTDLYEVVLVDDASSDNTKEYVGAFIKEHAIPLRYIRLENNSGRSVVRNTGILESKGEYVVFTDDDCILDKNFLKIHYEKRQADTVYHGAIWNLSYLKFFSDPSKGICFEEFKDRVVPQLMLQCIQQEDVLHNFDKITNQSKKTKFEKQVEIAVKKENSLFPWIGNTGGNFSCKRQAVIDVGMFDPNMGRLWGAEDIDLGYRLNKAGLKYQYLDDAKVYHVDHYRNNSTELSKIAITYMQKKYNDPLLEYMFTDFFEGSLNYEHWESITLSKIQTK